MFERSYHFVPANRSKLFDRIDSLGADAYVFDLEDAVSRDEKPGALAALEAWVSQQTNFDKIYVRLNGYEDSLAEAERTFLLKYNKLGVVLPKINSVEALRKSVECYQFDHSRRIIGLIEDASGVQALPPILELEILHAVGLGLEDFLSDSIFETSQLATLVAHVRSEIVIAAMTAGVDAIDTISVDTQGGAQLISDIDAARSAGFNAKFSIHPSQIEPINSGLHPSEESLIKVSKIFDAMSSEDIESGYLRLGSEIISPPKLKKLKTIKEFNDYHESKN